MRAICNEVEALVKKCGKPKMLDVIKLPPSELYKHVEVWFLSSFLLSMLLFPSCSFTIIPTFVTF